MELKPLEKKLLDYVQFSRFSYLSSSFLHLLASGRLSGQSFKYLNKLIKEGNTIIFEDKLIEHFKNYNIAYPTRQKYVNKYRQQAYRTKNKIIGKKQLNFYVNEELFNKIKLIKDDLELSYEELFEYLLTKV